MDKEFNSISEAAELAKAVKHPWQNIFSHKYRPQLILCGCSTLFQQWTGWVPTSSAVWCMSITSAHIQTPSWV